MGKIKDIEDVILVTAILADEQETAESALVKITERIGPIQEKSKVYPFKHTGYYSKEMGNQLIKFFVSFQHTIDPISIVDIKIFTNKIEDLFKNSFQNRKVNIDPGYIELPKLVLATTKNYAHRIYLGKGIYGDVQLYWRNGGFQTFPWTYPDYQDKPSIKFFTQVRNHLFNIRRS
jgi:hypothetical protein